MNKRYYQIVVEDTVPKLEDAVNRMILDGWACLGGPSYADGFWHQAMKLGGRDSMFLVKEP